MKCIQRIHKWYSLLILRYPTYEKNKGAMLCLKVVSEYILKPSWGKLFHNVIDLGTKEDFEFVCPRIMVDSTGVSMLNRLIPSLLNPCTLWKC